MSPTLAEIMTQGPKYKGVTIDGLPIDLTKKTFDVISTKLNSNLGWLRFSLFDDLYLLWNSPHTLFQCVDRVLSAPFAKSTVLGGPLYPLVRRDSDTEAEKMASFCRKNDILNVVVLPKSESWCFSELKRVLNGEQYDDILGLVDDYFTAANKYSSKLGIHIVEADFPLSACKGILQKLFEG